MAAKLVTNQGCGAVEQGMVNKLIVFRVKILPMDLNIKNKLPFQFPSKQFI